MKATMLYGPRDIRFEERRDPTILKPTDAIVRIAATCVCGSDLWPYRGIQTIAEPMPIGHEYCGVVEEVGSDVRHVKPGPVRHRFLLRVGQHLRRLQPRLPVFLPAGRVRGWRTSTAAACAAGRRYAGCHAADALQGHAARPVGAVRRDGTGWFGAAAAQVQPGTTVAVIGDGAVGLLAVLSARQMGAERIVAMSRHPARQQLARRFGATDIVQERGDEGVVRIQEMTKGLGVDCAIECVGTQESMWQAIHATRAGGHVGYVGVPHGVLLKGEELFFEHVHLHGGPAPVREYLPHLIRLTLEGQIRPGQVLI